LNNIFKIRLKSGALQFAIYTGAIVALLLLGVILYLHTFKMLRQNSEIGIDNIKAANIGFFKATKENNITSDTIIITDFNDQNQKVKIVNTFWGVFQKTVVLAENKNKKFDKCGLIGSVFSEEQRLSLYLKNNYKPLIVVGNTRIEGNVVIPEQGVQSGYIAGNSYLGDQLIYGNSKISSQDLPKLNNSLLNELDKYDKENKNRLSNYILNTNDKNVNSFLSKTKVIYDKNSFSVSQEIIGNFIIKSDNTITITATSKLKDVVVMAPEIIIEDDVKGSFQAIAINKIQVGKNVNLSYPSAIVINENKGVLTEEAQIVIDEFSTIKGIILFKTNKDLSNSFATHLKILENTKILGDVYCEGNFELKGEVWGSVYTHQFVSNTAGTIFINHLYNAKISAKSFPAFYSGLLFENQTKSTMKWLY
jgi:hypothetical protein